MSRYFLMESRRCSFSCCRKLLMKWSALASTSASSGGWLGRVVTGHWRSTFSSNLIGDMQLTDLNNFDAIFFVDDSVSDFTFFKTWVSSVEPSTPSEAVASETSLLEDSTRVCSVVIWPDVVRYKPRKDLILCKTDG